MSLPAQNTRELQAKLQALDCSIDLLLDTHREQHALQILLVFEKVNPLPPPPQIQKRYFQNFILVGDQFCCTQSIRCFLQTGNADIGRLVVMALYPATGTDCLDLNHFLNETETNTTGYTIALTDVSPTAPQASGRGY